MRQVQEDAVFAQKIDDWIRDGYGYQRPIRVMQTPLALQLVGAKNLPIYIDPSKLERVMLSDHSEITPEIIKQLPEALREPMMILKSKTQPDRIVAVLTLKDSTGIEIIVPFALDKQKEWMKSNVITSIYGKGDNGRPRYKWYTDEIREGRLLYADREKAAQFLTSAGVQFPLEEQTNSFLIYNIKDKEDLVKFKLQKEEEYKAAAAREAADEKDSSLLSQPADESHLQLGGTASYKPMVTDSIEAVNKEEAKMTAENAARKEASFDYADSYRAELADVCAASKESFTPAQNEKLKESAEHLYTEMREFEQSEGVCGSDQNAWDSFAALHERNIRSILAAKDISEATGRKSKAGEEAVQKAVQGIEESTAFISRSRDDLLQKQKDYEEQIEELRRRVEDISEAKMLGIGKEEDFTRTLAAASDFLQQIEGLRKEAANLPRKQASKMFKASRRRMAGTYYEVKFAPTQIKQYSSENAPQEVDRVLRQAAESFRRGIASLAEAKETIIRTTQETQSAVDFYREALKEEAKANGVSIETEERVALRMAKAGMGVYTIQATLERESPLREEMKAGKAKEIAETAKEKAAADKEEEREEDHRR